MTVVLVVYEEVPERTLAFSVPMTDEEFNKFRQLSGGVRQYGRVYRPEARQTSKRAVRKIVHEQRHTRTRTMGRLRD